MALTQQTTHTAAVSTFGGSLSVIICWGLSLFHVAVPYEVAVSFAMIASCVASWVVSVSEPKEKTS